MSHDKIEALLDWLHASVVGPDASIEQMRASYDRMSETVPDEALVEAVLSGAVHGVFVGPVNSRRVLLYFHGGAYTIGSSLSHRGLAWRLSQCAEARVLVVDYRLAPENVFPAAVDDALAAWSLLRHLDIDPSRIVVAGDSAGAALAVVTALHARDVGEPVAALVAFSAWTDLTATYEATNDDPILSASMLDSLAAQYLAGADPSDWRASPYFANLRGLPPVLIQVGTRELLFDDSRKLANKIRREGAEVLLDIYPQMIHVFQMYTNHLPDAKLALERAGAFIKCHTR